MDPVVVENVRRELKCKRYEAKWEVLRPIIEHLFIAEKKTTPKIAIMLREEFEFFATYESC
jgi:hypothetical protein